MAVKPVRLATPSFDHRLQAPVEPVAPVVQSRDDNNQHGQAAAAKDARAHAGHHRHVPGSAPTPRPRRSASAKTNRSRRRRRAGAPVEDDEIELPETELHADGVASVGFQDDPPDEGNDHDEGERERSRHERLGRVRGHQAEQAHGAESGPPGAPAGAHIEHAVNAFVEVSCFLVATWQPGDRAAMAMQRAKLQLLRNGSGVAKLDSGGLARVAEHLRERMPGDRKSGNPTLNLMLPLLVLQLQLTRSPDQLNEAIARVQASVWGSR